PCVEMPCVEDTSELGSKRAVTFQLMNMELLPTTTRAMSLDAPILTHGTHQARRASRKRPGPPLKQNDGPGLATRSSMISRACISRIVVRTNVHARVGVLGRVLIKIGDGDSDNQMSALLAPREMSDLSPQSGPK